jgi:hypothetical protein
MARCRTNGVVSDLDEIVVVGKFNRVRSEVLDSGVLTVVALVVVVDVVLVVLTVVVDVDLLIVVVLVLVGVLT